MVSLRRPLLGFLILGGAIICVYSLIGIGRSPITDLEIKGALEKYSAGEEMPPDVANRVPRAAKAPLAEGGGAPMATFRPGKKGRVEDQFGLTDLQMSKLVKRGKPPEAPERKDLEYRFRVERGWEVYRVPQIFRDKYSNTREALSLASQATGETVKTDRGREAFRINSVEEGSLLREVGILPGDVIISVNERPVTGPTDGRRLYSELRYEDRIWMVVDRKGEILNFYYELER